MFTRDYEGILNAFAFKYGKEAAIKAAEDIANDRLTTNQLLELEKKIEQAGREYDNVKKRESIRSGLLGANHEWFYMR